jgi:hypothetical protein
MKLKILLLAAALTLSGCLSLPESTPAAVTPDTVIADVTVYDDDTGELITPATAYQFVLGQDNVGFGVKFEAKLHGSKVSDTLTLYGKGPGYDKTIELPAEFGPLPLVNTIGLAQFEAQLGVVGVGEEFQPQGSFYPYRVESKDEETLSYRALPTDGQANLIAELGSNLVISLNDDDTMTQYLAPVVGLTFTVSPDGQGNTIMGLESGSYITTGGVVGNVQYGFTPVTPEVIGKSLRYEITVITVIPGGAVIVEGDYGVRDSQVLNAPFTGISEPAQDDGHDHTH